MVRLTTNEVGVVINIRRYQGPRPVVRVFDNKVNKQLTSSKELDLGVARTTFIKEIL